MGADRRATNRPTSGAKSDSALVDRRAQEVPNMYGNRLRIAFLLVALLFSTGCMTDVEVFFAGRTEAGRHFLLTRQSDRLLGTRLRANDELIVSAQHCDDGEQAVSEARRRFWRASSRRSSDYLLMRQNGRRHLSDEVYTAADRIWLLAPDSEAVVASVDFSTQRTYRSGTLQPDWATPTGGKRVENEFDSEAAGNEKPPAKP